MSLALPSDTGILKKQTTPLVTGGVATALQAVANVLGSTRHKNFEFDPSDVRAVETFTLERLLEDRFEYTGFTIASLMQDSNPAILDLFPMKETGAMSFKHEYFEFPKELAIATPAQAPPSYVEVEKRKIDVELERYALGATTTVQELRTSEGQMIFRGKLITVAIGFIEVAELLAIDLLLNLPSYYAQYYVDSGQHPIDLARTGRMKDAYWDIIRRRPNGWNELLEMAQETFSQQGMKITHMLVSEGTGIAIASSPMLNEFWLHGPGASDNARNLSDNVPNPYNGIRLVPVSPIDLPKKDLRLVPLEREVEIGQHFRIDRFHRECDLANYCSKFLTIQFFSMETNNWATVGPEDAIEHDFRFDEVDGGLHKWHEVLADDLDTLVGKSSVPIYRQQYDMFLYLATNEDGIVVANVCQHWGHMEHWALSESAAEAVAITSANAMMRAINKEDSSIGAISAGLSDISELFDRVVSDSDVQFAQLDLPLGRYGVRTLPATTTAGFPAAVGGNYMPAFYGTAAGYLEIATTSGRPGFDYINRDLVARAVAFKKAVTKMHRFFLAIYGYNHVALNPDYAPSYYLETLRGSELSNEDRDTASLLNFLSNIVDTPKARVFVNGSAQNALLQDFTPIDDASPYSAVNIAARNAGVRATQALSEIFGSEDRLAAFETEFEQSEFGIAYGNYIAQRATGSGGRRRRGGEVSVDAAAPLPLADGETQFSRFHTNEVVLGASQEEAGPLGPAQIAAFYGFVLDAVRRNPPRRVDAALLRAWSSAPGEALRADLQTDEFAEGSGLGRATAFAASIASLRQAADASQFVRDNVRIASPANPAQALDIENASFDGSGQNDNLLVTSIITSARAGGRRGGSSRRQQHRDGDGNSSGRHDRQNPNYRKSDARHRRDGDGNSSGRHDGQNPSRHVKSRATLGQQEPPVPGVRGRGPLFRPAAQEFPAFGRLGSSVPGFARNAALDVVDDDIVINDNLKDRYARFGVNPDWTTRVAGQLFILAQINKQVLLNFKKADIYLPMAWLIQQPWRRYKAQAAVAISKSTLRNFGNIRYMDFDTHIGRNAVNKNLMLHLSGYMAATIESVQDFFVLHDILVTGYDGGESTKPFTEANWDLASLDKSTLDGPSLIYMAQPAGSLVGNHEGKPPTTHDIRGFVDPVNYRGQSVHRASQFLERPYHMSALYYTTLLELWTLVTWAALDWNRFHRREGVVNTITHQGLQRIINPNTLNHDFVIPSSDPFKNSVHPGAADIRSTAIGRRYNDTTAYDEISFPL